MRSLAVVACVAAMLHGSCDGAPPPLLSKHHRHRGRPWLAAQEDEGGSDGRDRTSAASNVTSFRWAHFPTYDALRFVVFGAPVAATHWQITLASAPAEASGGQIAQLQGALPVATSGHTWTIPTLKAGSHTVTLDLTSQVDGAETAGTLLFTQTDTLNRTIRPWEGGSLGEEDILIPPFSALTATQSASTAGVSAWKKVGAIAREMTLTGIGLWGSVSILPPATPRDPAPTPIEILHSPIELVARIGGKRVAAAATVTGPVKVTKATPTVVETRSEWAAGGLSGSLQTHYDPDGCMKVELTLHKTSTPISELTLQIPLKLEEAPFMHAVTDLLRFHYAGRVPAGEGEVYNTTGIARCAPAVRGHSKQQHADATQYARRYQLPGPFVPYIWVGGAARGIAFFADSDQDWISAAPAYQLRRDTAAETLTLVVNLISPNAVPVGGVTLARQRNITFGIMTSPAKPQAAAPLASPRDWWLVRGRHRISESAAVTL